jgi:hypothetical protein
LQQVQRLIRLRPADHIAGYQEALGALLTGVGNHGLQGRQVGVDIGKDGVTFSIVF